MTLDEISRIQRDACPKFSVFARDKLPMPGSKKRLDEILNREILITDFRLTKSKRDAGKNCLQIQFLLGDEVCVTFTGSAVLADQIQSSSENMPFRSTIVKIDKYFSLS